MLQLIRKEAPLPIETRPGERRSAARFQVELSIQYSLVHRGKVLAAGRGKTVNVSSTGMLFRPDARLLDAREIHLTVEWPASRGRGIPVRLFMIGKVVRKQGEQTAVKLLRYEFRTK